MASDSGTLYIGVTSAISRRASEHKAAEGLMSFTARYRACKLVYFETYEDGPTAIAREKQIKSYRRAKKVALIEEHNPQWLDLFDAQ